MWNLGKKKDMKVKRGLIEMWEWKVGGGIRKRNRAVKMIEVHYMHVGRS
jgi:deoxyribose-phosphate aldolase